VLDKKKLKLLEIEQLVRAIETSQVSGCQNLKYVFAARIHGLSGKDAKKTNILAVTFFNLETSIPEFRMFFNRQNFITEILSPERKWSNATLSSLINFWHGKKAVASANERTAKLTCDFFKSDKSPYEAMQDWQKDLRDAQRAARHKKETDPIDERMKECRELPKDFEYWINEVALDFSRYIYYRRPNKGRIEGYCTSCKQDFAQTGTTKKPPLDGAKHDSPGKCPMCKKAITFKAIGKTTMLVDEVIAAYAQKTTDGFMLRYFKVTKRYCTHYKQPKLTRYEFVRDFYRPDDEGKWDVGGYEWDVYKQRGPMRWCPSKYKFKTSPACLYTRNLRHVFADTPWKYSAIYELAKNTNRFNVWGYLNVYKKHPLYEYLIKARLYQIVVDDVDKQLSGWRDSGLNLEGKSVSAVLRVDGAGFRQLQRLDGGFEYLQLLRSAYNAGVTLKDWQVKQFVEMGIDSAAAAALLKYTTPHKIANYCLKIAKDQRLRAYADERTPKGRMQQLSSFWADYLQNAHLLEYDMKNDFVLFPRDLKSRHDEVMKLYKAEKNELQSKAIQGMHQELLDKFGFSYRGLIVRPPISADEVIAEGHSLHHCVHSRAYIDNITKGKGFIFFVRQASNPDKPFFTAEVANGVVKQCRGFKNCSMTDEIKKFVAEWQKKKLAAA